jgi:RNA polymerase sigma factor (TIGR02999 family)
VDWQGRTHFFNVAAKAMRQILTDQARRRKAAKRGGHWDRVTLGQVGEGSSRVDIDLIALDSALTELAELDERRARIVELRFLAGLSVEETANLLNVSPRTVKLGWRAARAWLRQKLGEQDPP